MENTANAIIEAREIPEGMNAMYVTICPNAPSEEYAALGGLSCTDWVKEPLFSCCDFEMGEFSPRYLAIATTEHASSSYGLPVVILRDGTVLGPKDRAFKSLSFVVCGSSMNPLFDELKAAGYEVSGK